MRDHPKVLVGLVAVVVATPLIVASTTGPASATSTNLAPQTFTFTGHTESYTVPAGVHYVDIEAAGGPGGTGHNGGKGGKGIEVTGSYMAVTPGEVLRVAVGGKGGSAVGGGKIPYSGDGGWNGGGDGARGGGGGGGFSYVQAADGHHLVVAAGGGGGSGRDTVGGPQIPPGTLDGQNGGGSLGTPRGGGGGTLTGGGSGGHNPSPLVGDGKGGFRFGGGSGGVGLLPHGSAGGGGGGGGYNGGGGGAGSEAGDGGGGGAGSSYVYPNVVLATTAHAGLGEVTVTPESPAGAASAFSVSTATTTMRAGGSYDLTVTARDAQGVRDPDYRGTIHVSGSLEGALPENYTFTQADHGQRVFVDQVRFLHTSPDLIITATDVNNPGVKGASSRLTIEPNAIERLGITPSWLVVNRPQPMKITAYDMFDNRVEDVSAKAKVELSPEGTCTQPPAPATCTANSLDASTTSFHVVTAMAGSVSGRRNVRVATSPPTAPTSVDLRASSSRVARLQTVTLTATVSQTTPRSDDLGEPTGSVTFYDGTTRLGTGALVNQGGIITASMRAILSSAGNRPIRAQYSGDFTHVASEGSTVINVAQTVTSVRVTSSPNPSSAGTTVNLSAVVIASDHLAVSEGSVIVVADDSRSQHVTVPAAEAGRGFHFPTPLGPGAHEIQAYYLGSDNFSTSFDRTTQVVHGEGQPTSMLLQTSDNPIETNQPVAFTAVLTSPGTTAIPSGMVRFDLDGRSVGAPVSVINGRATSSPMPVFADVGLHEITAAFLPSGAFQATTAKLPGGLAVRSAPTTTTLEGSPNPSVPGEPVALNARVTSRWLTPEGRVQFTIDGRPAADPHNVINGVATIRLAPGFYGEWLTPGSHTLVAAFSPYNRSVLESTSSPLTQQVGAVTPTTTTVSSSTNLSQAGQPVTFRASVASTGVSSIPTGMIQFSIDGKTWGSAVPLHGGTAQSPAIADLAVGQHAVTAAYEGSNFDFIGSTGQLAGYQTVTGAPTQTVVTSSANPYVRGPGNQPPEFTVEVKAAYRTATGHVVLAFDTYRFEGDLRDGKVVIHLSQFAVVHGLGIGLHPVTATFFPDSPDFVRSDDSISQSVN